MGMPLSTQSAAGALVALVACLGGFAEHSRAAPEGGRIAMTCTNPYSGANWKIEIDYDRRTVDFNPAEISDASIRWQDDKSGRKYSLDRKSGTLTVTLASATGGNFLYDQCKLDK